MILCKLVEKSTKTRFITAPGTVNTFILLKPACLFAISIQYSLTVGLMVRPRRQKPRPKGLITYSSEPNRARCQNEAESCIMNNVQLQARKPFLTLLILFHSVKAAME